MFNRVIDKVDYVLSVYDTIAEIYTTEYNRSQVEETYLRNTYTVVPEDSVTPDEYILTWKDHHTKLADKEDAEEYYGLIHEVYLTHLLSGDEVTLQTIANVTFTENEIFVAFMNIEAITLEGVAKSGKVYDMLDALDSLFSQLTYLYENYNFTHYDLHSDNVLVDANNKAIIIDLQLSYANIGGIDYGVTLYDDTTTLITPKSYWPFDIYKLLMWCRSVSTGDITGLLNTMLMYFVDSTDYDKIKLFSTIQSPPRIDYMPEYSKYLTSFDLFYEYYLNVRATYY